MNKIITLLITIFLVGCSGMVEHRTANRMESQIYKNTEISIEHLYRHNKLNEQDVNNLIKSFDYAIENNIIDRTGFELVLLDNVDNDKLYNFCKSLSGKLLADYFDYYEKYHNEDKEFKESCIMMLKSFRQGILIARTSFSDYGERPYHFVSFRISNKFIFHRDYRNLTEWFNVNGYKDSIDFCERNKIPQNSNNEIIIVIRANGWTIEENELNLKYYEKNHNNNNNCISFSFSFCSRTNTSRIIFMG